MDFAPFLLLLLMFTALGTSWKQIDVLPSHTIDTTPLSQPSLQQNSAGFEGDRSRLVPTFSTAAAIRHPFSSSERYLNGRQATVLPFITLAAAAFPAAALMMYVLGRRCAALPTRHHDNFHVCAVAAGEAGEAGPPPPDPPRKKKPRRPQPPRVARRPLNGILLLDKPAGMGSNAALQKVRFIYRAEKAGHSGTLDPLASGMLPICFGRATKLAQMLTDSDKTYIVKAKLGERTDTQDAEGEVVARRPVAVTAAMVDAALAQFRGDIQQVPPMYSALKSAGQSLYKYALQGIDVPRPARPVTVYALRLLEARLQGGEEAFLRLEIHCSKGFYVRTLVDDLGEVLGCGAHVQELRRTTFSGYPVDRLVTLEEVLALSDGSSADCGTLEALDRLLLPMDAAVPGMAELFVTSTEAKQLMSGAQFEPEQLEALKGTTALPVAPGQPVKLMENGTRFFA
eukprot:EG_transcript_12430